ncbi:MAG: Co2+/Mg2+ efflux protein ApaG [Phycisphaerales bacterium]|nr:Co2+/Mg2+ efflux protein ApaG [Phycisphaerales bacterium]
MPLVETIETPGSDAVTASIRVTVWPRFEPDQSDPHQRQFIFSYRIRITNESGQPVQLVARRWIIIDAHGSTDVVEGPGVLGRQPHIGPGEHHEYASFCPLRTSWGTMEGSYTMRCADGCEVQARVARFYLVTPAGVLLPT